jgi:hypothetical protein
MLAEILLGKTVEPLDGFQALRNDDRRGAKPEPRNDCSR